MAAKKKSSAQFHVVFDSSSYRGDDGCSATLYRRDGNTKPWRVVYEAYKTGPNHCDRAVAAVVNGYRPRKTSQAQSFQYSIGPLKGGLPGDEFFCRKCDDGRVISDMCDECEERHCSACEPCDVSPNPITRSRGPRKNPWIADEVSVFKSPYRASVERLSANHYEVVLTRTDSAGRSVVVKRVEKRGPKARDLADRAANQMLRQHRPAKRQANPVNTKPYKAAVCDRCEAEYHWSRIGSQCDCGKPLRSVELFYDRDGILREKKRSTSSTKKKPVRKPNPVYESLTPNPLEFKERGVKTPFKLMQPHVQGNPRRRSLRK